MSEPGSPEPVKLIASLFSPDGKMLRDVIDQLAGVFSPPDWISDEVPFDRTRYYAREMGWPLFRRFVSFEQLISPEELVEAKLRTNAVEQQHRWGGSRRVNIDPGYIALERLVLATGKNYVHRIYLSKGIYADLTLIFHRGSFRPLQWTYPDYAEPETVRMFTEVRSRYTDQLKETRGFD